MGSQDVMKKLLLSVLETKIAIARKVNMARSQRVNPANKLTRPEHECVTRESDAEQGSDTVWELTMSVDELKGYSKDGMQPAQKSRLLLS